MQVLGGCLYGFSILIGWIIHNFANVSANNYSDSSRKHQFKSPIETLIKSLPYHLSYANLVEMFSYF